MAAHSIKDKDLQLKGAAMADDPRLVGIEGRVSRLEQDVGDIKLGIKELLGRPQTPGLGHLLKYVISILGICAFIFGFAEWRLKDAITPVTEAVAAVRKEGGELNREVRDRTEEMLKAVYEAKIHTAVLEERSVWMRAQGGWKSSIEMR